MLTQMKPANNMNKSKKRIENRATNKIGESQVRRETGGIGLQINS